MGDSKAFLRNLVRMEEENRHSTEAVSKTETSPQTSLELLASCVIKFGLFGITLWFNICITSAVNNPIFPQFRLTPFRYN